MILLEKAYERCVEICSFKSIMEFGEAQYTVAKKSILLLSIHQQLCLRSSKEIQGSKSVRTCGKPLGWFPITKRSEAALRDVAMVIQCVLCMK